jgi:hypothetical protein
VPLGFDALLIQPFFPIESGFDTHHLIGRIGYRCISKSLSPLFFKNPLQTAFRKIYY